MEHIVAVYLAWAEHRRVLRDVGNGDLSRSALVQAMERGGLGCSRIILRSSYACQGESGARKGNELPHRPP